MNSEEARAAALPLTPREIQCVAKSTLAACQAGCHFDNATAMSALTMATSTLIHHAALEAGVDRSGLLDSFFDGLVAMMNQIDQGESI